MMKLTQKIWGGVFLGLLVISLAANIALFLWAKQQTTLAERRLSRIESLEQEMAELRQELETLKGEAHLDDTMDTVTRQTEDVRGLESLSTVNRRLVNRAELGQVIGQKLEEEYSSPDIRQDELLLIALDLMPPETDLFQLLNGLLEEQVAGLYDPADETFYVLSGGSGLGPMSKLIFAHEYTHALQDQHFDLEGLGVGPESDKNDDQLLALYALIEGDATLTMQQHMLAHFSPLEMMGLAGAALGVDQTALNEAPPYFRKSLAFPYQDGLIFATTLFQQGGWAAVNAAFENPPQSSEQILHPMQYPNDTPQSVTLPTLTKTLGEAWELVTENVLGEFTLRLHLDTHLTQRQAVEALTGWGGDHYALYQNTTSGEILLAVRLAWDSQSEEDEFVTIYREYATQRFGEPKQFEDGASLNPAQWWWVTKNKVLFLAQGEDTLLLFGPDVATIEQTLARFSDF